MGSLVEIKSGMNPELILKLMRAEHVKLAQNFCCLKCNKASMANSKVVVEDVNFFWCSSCATYFRES